MPPRRRLTPYQGRLVAASQDWKCALCKQLLPPTYQLDHRIPLCANVANANHMDNFQALCPNCHSRKTVTEMYNRTRGDEWTCPYCGILFSKFFTHTCK